MKTIWKTIRINLDDLLAYAAVVGGAFLLLEVVIAVVLMVIKTEAETSVAMGWIMLPIVAGFIGLFMNSMHTVVTFETMLRFSITRRAAILTTAALTLVETYAGFALAVGLGELDRLIARGWCQVYHLREVEMVSSSFPLPVLLLAPLGVVVMGLGAGAVLQRFGRKAFWVLWGLWMAFIVFQSVIPWHDIIESLGGVSPLLVGAAVGVGGLVIAALSVWSMMRATVKN